MSKETIGSTIEESLKLNRSIERNKSLYERIGAYSKGERLHCGPTVTVIIDDGYGGSEKLVLTKGNIPGAGTYDRKAINGSSMVMLGLKKMLSAKIDKDIESLLLALSETTKKAKDL